MSTQHNQNSADVGRSELSGLVRLSWRKSMARSIWNDLTPAGRFLIFPVVAPLCYLVAPIALLCVPIAWLLWKAEKPAAWVKRLFFTA